MAIDWIQIIVGIVSSALIAGLGKWLNIKLDESQRAKLDWALKQGVAAAAERFKQGQGFSKKQLAISTAESLAPKAMAKLDDEQKSVLVDATYARLKPQLLNTTFVHHGDGLAQQTEVVKTLPRPPKLPQEPTP